MCAIKKQSRKGSAFFASRECRRPRPVRVMAKAPFFVPCGGANLCLCVQLVLPGLRPGSRCGKNHFRAPMKNKKIIIATALIVAVLLGYWVKNQIGINMFGSASLSGFFPFSRLQRNHVIADSKPGNVIEESFDSRSIVRHWGELWMREKGKVTRGFDDGGRDHSRCLLVNSDSEKSWSFGYYAVVEVEKRDVFGFSGFIKQDGVAPNAYLRVSAFDDKGDVVKWNYAKEGAGQVGGWVFVRKKFEVGDGIKYLKFGMVGIGKGAYRFDDLVFQKY